MWRSDGQGEFYTYTPPFTIPGFEVNGKQCSVPPFSECNPQYGNSVGRGAFGFKAGTRTTVAERVRLNDVGKANGEIELWVNGKSVIKVTGLILRAKSSGRIRGLMMQTFFGGMWRFFLKPTPPPPMHPLICTQVATNPGPPQKTRTPTFRIYPLRSPGSCRADYPTFTPAPSTVPHCSVAPRLAIYRYLYRMYMLSSLEVPGVHYPNTTRCLQVF